MNPTIKKSDEEWREKLSDEEFRVTRKHATERPFTGKYHDHHETGQYECICCGTQLFHSGKKFESGTGWPSFTEPMTEKNVGRTVDKGFFMTRTEVHCSQCAAHLGHVFDDGPKDQGGLRYCINSASLQFEKDKT